MSYVWDWGANNPGQAATRPDLKAPAPGPNPNEPGSKFENTPEGWAQYKEVKRAYLSGISQMDHYVDQNLMMGASLEDLGVLNQKEHGQARWRKYNDLWSAYGRTDPSFEYDWGSGQKKNIATSWRDPVTGERPGWQPITAQERAEYKAQQGWGGGQGSYVTRLQNQGRAWFESGVGKSLQKQDNGLYLDPSSGIYMDPYGAHTNAEGARTGGAYGYPGGWSQNWPGKNTTPWGKPVIGAGGTGGGNSAYAAMIAGLTGAPAGTTPAPGSTPAPGGTPTPGAPNPTPGVPRNPYAMGNSFRRDPMGGPAPNVSGMAYQTGPLQQNPTPLTNQQPGGQQMQKPLPTYQQQRSRINPYRGRRNPYQATA